MNIIEKAIQFATKAHEGACRKGTTLPYILHPLEAGAIAAQITDDPEVIAASVLHDVVEDTSFSEADIRVLFGNRIADLVMFDTEDKLRDRPAAETWMTRKQETMRRLQHATDDEMIVVFADKLAQIRQDVDVVLLGGVFFKYQPVRSGRTLKEDLLLGMERCEAIVCTGEGTGVSTPFKKIKGFKGVVNDFPVIVGAGVTLDTIEETFRLADGAIVGSWFKDGHVDTGHVNEEYVRQMVEKIVLRQSNLKEE